MKVKENPRIWDRALSKRKCCNGLDIANSFSLMLFSSQHFTEDIFYTPIIYQSNIYSSDSLQV